MNWNAILSAVYVLVGIGAVAGVMLLVADRFMHVPVDERAEQVTAVLPGANCGACGFAGCADYAAGVVAGAAINLCVPGGDKTSVEIAEIMGTEAEDIIESLAFVRCRGDRDATSKRYRYIGVDSCAAASMLFKGDGACSFGCIGFGDCVAACRFDAMHIVNGIAKSDPNVCNGCGACAAACPKEIIDILPVGKKAYVACSSTDKGGVSAKLCKNSCIGCMRCVKACEYDAVHVTNFLAKVDHDKCVGCAACVSVCPTSAILLMLGEQSALEDAIAAAE